MKRRLFLPAILALASCQSPEPEDTAPLAQKALVFHMKTKESTYEGCIAGSPDCTYIRFDYPVIVEAPEGVAVESITETVRAFLMQPVREGEESVDTTELLDRFITDYREFRAREPRSPQSWFVERKAFVLENRPRVLSLSFSEKSYLGGAHGIETLLFRNIDPETGGTIGLSEILRVDALPALVARAEAEFRETRQIEEGASLADAGFTFPEGAFTLTDNFEIGAKGLTFYYNTLEVAPYALGPTEIFIPYPEIRDFLNPEYLGDETT